MSSSLQNLMDQRQLWRARDSSDDSRYALASGWPRLDRELYGAGWPIASISELLCAEPVLAWRLLQPALVQLSQQQRLLVWVGQANLPYAPAWLRAGLCLERCLLVRANEDEALWAAEQALRLAQGGAVIVQSDQLKTDRLRRLQLAAQAGNSFAFLLRPVTAQRYTTPAVLRMALQPARDGLQITLHKRRGGAAAAPFLLPMAAYTPELPAAWPRAQAPSELTWYRQLKKAEAARSGEDLAHAAMKNASDISVAKMQQPVLDKPASVTLPPRMAASFFTDSIDFTAAAAEESVAADSPARR